jgi:hypothetical protein
LGACLGLLNGTLYLVLAAFAIYSLSYWTVQIGIGESQPKSISIVNRLGLDLQKSGFSKVARSVDGNSEAFYDAADLAGLIYNNSLLEARLARYPSFLALAERPEFLDLASDTQFTEMRQRQEPVMNILNYPKVEAILENSDTLKAIWQTIVPDLKDLRAFLETGRSAKYDDEKILGRWSFDVNAALAMLRRAKPNIIPTEMQKIKRAIAVAFAKTTFIAAPAHEAILKNVPANLAAIASTVPAPGELQTLRGEWTQIDGKYQVKLTGSGKEENYPAAIDGARLTITAGTASLVFDKED